MKKNVIVFLAVLAGIGVVFAGIYWMSGRKNSGNDTEEKKESSFAGEERIAEANKTLQNNPEAAPVLSNVLTVQKKAAIIFEGMTDEKTVEQIIEMLKKNKISATFFPSAIEAKEEEESIKKIVDAGYRVENGTLSGSRHMEKMETEAIIADFSRAQEVFASILPVPPVYLKFSAANEEDRLLKIAEACRFDAAIQCDHYLNYSSFQNYEGALDYVTGMEKGRIISIKLEGELDETEYTKQTEKPLTVIDKQPGRQESETKLKTERTEEERLTEMVSWFLTAIKETDYEIVAIDELAEFSMKDMTELYRDKRMKNNGKLAELIQQVHTTDREISFLFRGIGDEEILSNILHALKNINAQGTFFVTGTEIDNYQEQIERIREAGHEIANGGYSGKRVEEEDYDTVCQDIAMGMQALELLGISSQYYMPASGVSSDVVREAASAMGVKLFGYTSAPAKKAYEKLPINAEQIVAKAYKNDRPALCRGDMVYMNLTTYEDKQLLADLIGSIYEKRMLNTKYGDSMLIPVTLSRLMDNTWTYPASTRETDSMIAQSGSMKGTFEEMLENHYIGNPNVILEGFSAEEINRINTNGKIKAASNTIFLTFDDWGSESSIGRLLQVLKKWGVKATFFVKTQYVLDSRTENLLRAIAEDGHKIGSHTNTHMRVNIGEAGRAALQQDLIAAHQILSEVAGDTGAVTDYFRPPTLAVSKSGLQTVFDSGYGYVISGDFSTADYDCTSSDEVLDRLLNGIPAGDGSRQEMQSGSIIVMHMSDSAAHTAAGLDRFLAYQAALPDSDTDKYSFAVLRDYLK